VAYIVLHLKNVRVYYGLANSEETGFDIYEGMHRLGKEYLNHVFNSI